MNHILRRVELWNFKSHEHTNVRFQPGINAICGKNYAGKTSILQAVGICLYNSCVGNLGEYIRKGTKHATVHVEFASLFDERVYRVERRLGSGAYWKLRDMELDVEVAQQEVDVSKFLCQHLRLGGGTDLKRLFKDAVGVPQGNITASFLVPASGRKPIFDGLLRVEEYRTAWDNMRAVESVLRTRIAGLDTSIASLEAKTEALPSLDQKARELAVQVTAAEREIADLELRVQEMSSTEAEYAAKKLAVTDMAGRVEAAKAVVTLEREKQRMALNALADSEAALSRLDELLHGYTAYLVADKCRDELSAKHRERHALLIRLNSVRGEFERLTGDMRLARERADTAQAAAADVDRLVPLAESQRKLESALSAAKSHADRLNGELGAARKSLAAARNGVCPLLGEQCQNARQRGKPLNVFIGDRAKEAADMHEQAANACLQAQLALDTVRIEGRFPADLLEAARSASVCKEALEARLRQAEAAVEEQRVVVRDAESLLAPFADLDTRIEACKGERNMHKEAYAQYLQSQGEAEKIDARKLAALNCGTAVESAEAAARERTQEAANAKTAYDDAGHAMVAEELIKQKDRYATARANLIRDRSDLKEAESALTAIRLIGEELDICRADRLRQNAIISVTEDIREAIRAAGPKVGEMVVTKVSSTADRLFSEMIGDNNAALHWSEDYEIHLVQHGVDRGLETAAGSEQVLAALAVRLALIESLGEVRFVFLDEPTVHLDETRRAALVEQLGAFTLFDQLVVISHDDSFEAKVGNVIRVDKVEERSFVS